MIIFSLWVWPQLSYEVHFFKVPFPDEIFENMSKSYRFANFCIRLHPFASVCPLKPPKTTENPSKNKKSGIWGVRGLTPYSPLSPSTNGPKGPLFPQGPLPPSPPPEEQPSILPSGEFARGARHRCALAHCLITSTWILWREGPIAVLQHAGLVKQLRTTSSPG